MLNIKNAYAEVDKVKLNYTKQKKGRGNEIK